MAILPDLDRVKEFIQLKTPSSKEDLQSLMGLLATFHKWNIDIAKETTNMRKLLMIDNIHSVELKVIRNQMTNLLPLSPFTPLLQVTFTLTLLFKVLAIAFSKSV